MTRERTHKLTQKFITTEVFSQSGELGERQVWETVCHTFAQRHCIAYWRYPIFSKTGAFRKEPDILIVDAEFGLIVIEVKSITLEQIVGISGHVWELQQFYTTRITPYQQAENQLYALLQYCQIESQLKHQVCGRAIVALPFILSHSWQQRGLEKLPSSPPILFKDDLVNSSSILDFITQTPSLVPGKNLSPQQWELLQAVIAGTPLFRPPTRKFFFKENQNKRGEILAKVREYISKLDLNQERIAKQIPPGLQRIRGIAGSGKTVLLCQKAAQMHLKYPDWDIALVFFSRSLYEPIIQQLDQWLRRFSCHQVRYDSHNQKLRVLHAWGSKEQPGLYNTICQAAGIWSLSVRQTSSSQPHEALAEACYDLLQKSVIPQLFDAILIDEGQDLLVEDELKFEGKQPFYWMAYQALCPVGLQGNQTLKILQRRLIWAEDEMQSLETLKSPNPSELFGDSWGHLLTGLYSDSIQKTEVLSRSYRLPTPILMAAYGISFGLLRPAGLLTKMTRIEDWEAIGFQVHLENTVYSPGQKITLSYSSEFSPHPVSQFWQHSLIEFETYRSRQDELTALTQQLYHNLRIDGLRPSREILVIILGDDFEAIALETYVANFLISQGLDIYIPGTVDCNIISSPKPNPNQFWCEGGITISRIHRAKGQEADMVYLVGFDYLAKDEANLRFRQQLFIALTRSRGWVRLTGTGAYPMYNEMARVIQSGNTFSFTQRQPILREIGLTEVGEMLRCYRQGKRNFRGIDLVGVDLTGVCLREANLMDANLAQINLTHANLEGAKLLLANLSQAVLNGANLQQAKLVGANLSYAQLTHANLTHADLRDSDLIDILPISKERGFSKPHGFGLLIH
ncbi:pentapeptide repeat-containing protein [Limnoraphis robusta Tam1]|uniref:pentapeptide repeat-containing protein n=1 Tax=Limnoraphis robusta TaxID=1118279 RepID=UPI002B218027|nr:pentapeptide repeat-containing protein [Limnoraphis robusta]MEA5537832.1 pentapeptide repeat-containing protein [Limnoraphis robusta Tam1]